MITKEFLQQNLDLTEIEAKALYRNLKSNPQTQLEVLCQNEIAIEDRINFYKNLGISGFQLANYNFLLTYNTKVSETQIKHCIRAKIKYLENELDIKPTELYQDSFLQLLALDCTHTPAENPFGLQARVEFFKKKTGATNENLKKNIQLLRFDVTETPQENSDGIQAKLEVLKNLGLSKEYVANHLTILMAPAQKLPIRYAMGISIFKNTEFLNNPLWATFDENKTFARFCYLKYKFNDATSLKNIFDGENDEINPSSLYLSTPRFEKRFNVKDENLQTTFPLTDNVKQTVKLNYLAFANVSEQEK